MSAAPPVFTTQVQEDLWMEEFSSIILNSSALDSVNSYAQKGGELASSDLKGRRLKAMATSQEASHRWVAAIAGTFDLIEVDHNGEYVTRQVTDTLDVVLTDLSVWARLKEGVTSRPSFWMPTTVSGTNKLIKGYLPMGYPVEQVEQGELAKSSNGSNDSTSSEGFTPNTMDEMLTIKTLGRRDVLLAYDPSTGKYEPVYDGRRSRWPYRGMMWRTRNSGYDNIGFVPVAAQYYSAPVWGGGWNNWGWNSGWFGGGVSVGIGWNSGWNGWNGCAPVGGGVIYDPHHWPFWGSTPTTRFYPMLFSQAHAWQTAAVVNNYNYWGDGCMKSAEMPADAQPQYVAAPAVSQRQVGRDVEPIAQASGKAITTIPATGVGVGTSGSKPSTTGSSTEPRREVFSGIQATGVGVTNRTSEGSKPNVPVGINGSRGEVLADIPPTGSGTRTTGSKEPIVQKPAPATTTSRSGGGVTTRRVVAENQDARHSVTTQGARTPVAVQQTGGRGQYAQNQAVGRSSNGRPQQPTYVGGGARSGGGSTPMVRTNGGVRPGGQPPAMRGGSMNRGGGPTPMMRGSVSRGASAPQRSK